MSHTAEVYVEAPNEYPVICPCGTQVVLETPIDARTYADRHNTRTQKAN